MLKTLLTRAVILVILAGGSEGFGQPSAGSPDPSPVQSPVQSMVQSMLNRYCVTCHSERLRTAGLVLEGLDVTEVPAAAAVWEKVVRKLRSGSMPPDGVPRPAPESYRAAAGFLVSALDRAAVANPDPGRPTIRRLNRLEYANAIRDLLAVEVDGSALLPADDSSYGFDNIGNILSVSPVLLERYLAAAKKIRRLALGDSRSAPIVERYPIHKYLMQSQRQSEDLPFGSRGGIAVRHPFPADGEYVLSVQFQRNSRDYIRGLRESHELDLRIDGERVALFPIGGERRGVSSGIFSTAGVGDPAQEDYERHADEVLKVRVRVEAGARLIAVSFLQHADVPEGPAMPPMTQSEYFQYKGGDPAVGAVSVDGPYNVKGLGETASRRKIFSCYPENGPKEQEEQVCARQILSRLARSAYRRPVTDEDMDILLDFFAAGREEGGFEEGIGLAVERVLIGPEFIFRAERDHEGVTPGEAYPLSDLELASRLSFFLWSSIPDEELLGLAAEGKLSEPGVLEAQARRMLADPRSEALVDSFAGQWLFLRNLRNASPDPDVFPYFDENLREAFLRESLLLFGSIVREDRSVMDLLNADYTFVNDRLASHYKIPGVYGSHFRRVELQDESRRGLLGQGSILTVTSYANRTSPVARGKWVLENLLGTPPPPPPPNVPALKERSEDGLVLSMRERMESHRANPACAVCHKVMDPLGFALENFDAIGQWRATDGGAAIDPSGELPDGTQFNGPAGLRKALLNRREEFVGTFAEKLLTYALGRGLEYYDVPVIRKLLRESEPSGYRLSSIIVGIVKSTPFQMRRTLKP